MTTGPSTLGPNGRDPGTGRFAPGNRLGRGNPLAGRAAKIRAELLRVLSPTEARRIAKRLLEQAKTGDLAAIRELLDRTIGKPATADVLERLDEMEARLQTLLERKER